jgi:hypothetical protein
MFAGLMHNNIANMNRGIEKLLLQSIDWIGSFVVVSKEDVTIISIAQ